MVSLPTLLHLRSNCGCEEVGVVLILLETVVTSAALGDEHFDPQGVLVKQVQLLSNIFTQLEKVQHSAKEKARDNHQITSELFQSFLTAPTFESQQGHSYERTS